MNAAQPAEYEAPVVRDYGDLVELTATVVGPGASEDGVNVKSNKVVVAGTSQ